MPEPLPPLVEWLYAAFFFFLGIAAGGTLAQWSRRREEQAHVCRPMLRVVECLLVNCEVETLVTVNDDDGMYELREWAIMRRALWEDGYLREGRS